LSGVSNHVPVLASPCLIQQLLIVRSAGRALATLPATPTCQVHCCRVQWQSQCSGSLPYCCTHAPPRVDGQLHDVHCACCYTCLTCLLLHMLLCLQEFKTVGGLHSVTEVSSSKWMVCDPSKATCTAQGQNSRAGSSCEAGGVADKAHTCCVSSRVSLVDQQHTHMRCASTPWLYHTCPLT
jgi:hypothetical protein